MITDSLFKKGIYKIWIRFDTRTDFIACGKLTIYIIQWGKMLSTHGNTLLSHSRGAFSYWAWVQSQNPARSHDLHKKSKAPKGRVTKAS